MSLTRDISPVDPCGPSLEAIDSGSKPRIVAAPAPGSNSGSRMEFTSDLITPYTENEFTSHLDLRNSSIPDDMEQVAELDSSAFAVKTENVARGVLRCIALFNEQFEKRQIWAEDQLARFKTWTTNIGVFAGGHASLDYRLRDIPEIMDLVMQQIVVLRMNLSYILGSKQNLSSTPGNSGNEITANAINRDSAPPSPATSSASSLLSGSSIDSEVSPEDEAAHAVEETITRLYRLSTALRKSGHQHRDLRAETYQEIQKLEPINGHPASDINWTTQFSSFASKIVPWKIPRRAGSPGQPGQPIAENWLQNRFAKSIAKRRNRFLYWRKHQRRLERPSSLLNGGPPASSTSEHIPPKSTAEGASAKRLQRKTSPATEDTYPSKVDRQAFAKFLPSSKGSSKVTSASFIWKNKDEFPRPPKIGKDDSHFLCPLCFIPCGVKEAKGELWIQHLIRDMKPYICLFKDCRTPDELFGSFREWMSHMAEEQMPPEWHCASAAHDTIQSFPSQSEFENHMRSQHLGTFTESQLPMLAQRGVRQSLQVFADCPLCDFDHLNDKRSKLESQTILQRHVAEHLQSLALLSLPIAEDDGFTYPLNEDSSSGKANDGLPTNSSQLLVSDREGDSTSISPSSIGDPEPQYTSTHQEIPAEQKVSWDFIPRTEYGGHSLDPKLFSFIQKETNVRSSEGDGDLFSNGVILDRRYRIISPLYHGSFTQVLLAEDAETGGFVAIKSLKKPAADKAIITFALGGKSVELALHRRLGSHPNIVNLAHYFETDAHVYLVLEYCQQGDLYEAIRIGCGPLETEHVRQFMLELVDAVAFMHSKDVYHRDIKPENIFLAQSGSMKLGDFGLATTEKWTYETTVGSDRYMSPEQYDSAGAGYSPAQADIWAIGICLLNILFSRNPFTTPTEADPLFLDFSRDKQSLFDVFPTMSQDAYEVIAECMSLDPRKRSLFKVREALQRVVNFTTLDEAADDFCGAERGTVATANREPLRTPSIQSPQVDQRAFPWAESLQAIARPSRQGQYVAGGDDGESTHASVGTDSTRQSDAGGDPDLGTGQVSQISVPNMMGDTNLIKLTNTLIGLHEKVNDIKYLIARSEEVVDDPENSTVPSEKNIYDLQEQLRIAEQNYKNEKQRLEGIKILTRERDNKQRDEKGRQEYRVKWHADVPDKLSVDPNHPKGSPYP